MMEQDEDASDVSPLLETLELLLIPVDLLSPLCRWEPTCVRIEKNKS
jgi:hypothetical protein